MLVNQSFYLYKISWVEFGAGHSPTQYKITNKKITNKIKQILVVNVLLPAILR